MNKPIICLDFDGVVHRYSGGWKDGEIYDNITDGFFDWTEEACKTFKLVIFSSRSKYPMDVNRMRLWYHKQLEQHERKTGKNISIESYPEFVTTKPTAFLSIDDRALTFTGNWSNFPPSELIKFKPWNMKKDKTDE